MKPGSFFRSSLFENAIRAVTRTLGATGKGTPLAILGLVALLAGVVGLAQNPLAREVLQISMHRATRFLRWPVQVVQAQGGGGGTFTVFDAPGAGTGMLQGTMGTSINDAGEIAGIYLTAPNVAHGFVRANTTGAIAAFDAPNAGTSLNQGTFPASINAGGDIAGMYFAANNSYHGFVRAGATGTITEFDVPGVPTTLGHRGTLPLSINTGGDITGFYVDASDIRHGFVRLANGTFATIDAPGAGTAPTQGTIALSINAAGDITGLYRDASGTTHGFVRAAAGTITAPLDAPGAGTGPGGKVSFSGTLPTSINVSKEIAGVYADNNGAFHGFVYTAGSATPAFTTFDVPGVGAGGGGVIRGTAPASINSAGDVSGVYADSSGVNHGFVRTAAAGTFTAPVDAPSATTSGMFSGTLLISINSTDEITGTFEDTNGVFHGFLLTPAQPPPSAATPSFSPPGGTYTSAQTVTISDATVGATIYFTTDGSTPTTSSAKFTTPIPVSTTTTIKAIAAASGFSNSTVGSATYTFNPDFQVSVNPATLTIVAGKSGTAMFTVTPVNGFNTAVSFSCTGLPAEAACNFNPASVTPNGAAASSTLTVATTAKSASLRQPPSGFQPFTYASLLPVLAAIFAFATWRRRKPPALRLVGLGLFILLLFATGLTSCASGNNSGGNPGTPIGTTSVSVSASTSGSGGTSHAATLTITVTQ